MTAFATVLDLQAGWRPITPNEEAVAGALLERASDLVRCAFEDRHACVYDVSPARMRTVKTVVCDIVRYSFEASPESVAWDTGQVGGGLIVTEKHLQMLGLSGTHAGLFGLGLEDGR